ncbi:MAG: hypothetical protein IKE04_05610 [Oscillospiraceae bacterium]|nr:hypothetical protein [Oscillospiraceae bacterium]
MTEGWCYEHNYPFCMVPANGQLYYACPICFKATETYISNMAVQANGTVRTDWIAKFIYDTMVHGVPEKEESGDGH